MFFQPRVVVPSWEKAPDGPHPRRNDELLANNQASGQVSNKYTWQNLLTLEREKMVPMFNIIGETIPGLDPKETEVERSQVINTMLRSKMPSGTRVALHLILMEGFLCRLLKLGHPVTERMALFAILSTLSDEYIPFLVEYWSKERNRSMGELRILLFEVEPRILRIVNYKVELKTLPKEIGRKERIKGKKRPR